MKIHGKWTVIDVADRLEQAAQTLRRLPKVKVQGYRSFWPEVVREAMEAYGYNDAVTRQGPPIARRITEMEEALEWYLFLDKRCVKVVWLRSCGLRWKKIQKFTCEPGKLWHVNTLKNDYASSMARIAEMLNGGRKTFRKPYIDLLKDPRFGG